MKQRLLTILLTLLPLLASADEVEIDGIYYNIIKKVGQAEVISNPNKYSGSVVIPESIVYEGKNYSVTSIGNSAFSYCSGLTSVTIPNSVTSIGIGAFSECCDLTSVTIPNSVTSIGDYAFYECRGLISVTIPNSVTSIGKCAFDGCSGLTSVTIPNSVTTIDDGSFRGCGLTAVTIPNSVTFIGERAFEYCRSLISVTIPNGVTSIGRETFLYCRSLTSMTIPNSVTSIGENAFLGCRSLTSVTIPNSMTSIGESAFCECLSLASVTIPNSVTSIGEKAFDRCISLTSVTIPNSVTSIGDFVFSGCSGLISVTIPNSVIIIGESAFANCSSITSLSLPDNLKMIKNRSFYNCSGLTSITIPATVEVIYQEAFAGCSSLEQINALPTTPPFIYDKTFSDYSVPLKVPSGCVEAYKNAEFWKNFTNISDGTKIYKLTYIIDGKEFKTIDVLYGSEITPEPNPTKEGYTFSGWSEIPSSMPDHDVTVTGTFTVNSYWLRYYVDGDIEPYATTYLEYGQTITPIPEPTKLGYVFSGWFGLPETMPARNLKVSGKFSVAENCIQENYIFSKGLIFEITSENECELLSKYSFDNDMNLKYGYYGSVLIPERINVDGKEFLVTSIQKDAFSNSCGITSITIPGSLKSIGEGAFYDCCGIDSGFISDISSWCNIQLQLSEREKESGPFSSNPFRLCRHIYINNEEVTELIIPDGVTSISDAAFVWGGSFTSLTIPSSVISIGEHTFHISTLQQIKVLSTTPPAIHDNTFYNYSATLIVPTGSINAYKNAEGWKNFTSISDGNLYKLTYIVDGEEVKTMDLPYGEVINPEEEPTKEGYTFSGWSEIPETMPDHDVTVTGSFTINKYKLTYLVDGEEYKTYDVEYNSTITPETAPTKEGYTFSGWSEIPETMPAHDVTITGSFERVYSGGDVTNLINLLLFGNVDDEDIALYDMNGDGELNIGDLILIMRAAQQNSRNRSAANRAAENQTIEFAADIITMKPGETSALNISLSSSISGIYGIQFEVNLPEGFSLEKGSNDMIYEMSANQVDDITCNERDLGNGTYRFFIYSSTLQELKGGSLMSLNLKADADKALGNYSVSISNVALSDYDGHVTKEDGSSVGVKVTNSFTLLYQVDGEDYKSYEIECGENITPEAEPTKEGYTFSGWSNIPETMPAEDVIVTGTFTVNQYILTYVVDGAVYKEYSYDYGSAIAPEAEPTKEGYTFSGWSDIPETMPANGVYVVGKFTINKYKITYVIDGVVFKTEEVEYGSTITPPNPGDHEGYDFAWEDYPTTMPAEDILIYGTYTATGIEAILASEPDVKIFTVSGKPLNKLQKGVNILRYKDGRTRKIVVK